MGKDHNSENGENNHHQNPTAGENNLKKIIKKSEEIEQQNQAEANKAKKTAETAQEIAHTAAQKLAKIQYIQKKQNQKIMLLKNNNMKIFAKIKKLIDSKLNRNLRKEVKTAKILKKAEILDHEKMSRFEKLLLALVKKNKKAQEK